MYSLFNHLQIVIAQAAGSSEGTPGTEEQSGAIKDETGEVDVSLTSIWETIDNMIDGFINRVPHILIALVAFGLFFLVAKLVRSMVRKVTEDRESANVGKVMGRLAQGALIFIGLMIAVAIIAPSVTPGKLLTALGVGGVAIGFAFKDILQNFMAGVLLLLREPFQIGDQIISGGHEGTVESIETRATYIRTYDGRRVIIPNSEIYTNPVVVNTAFDSQRTQYDVGIGYGDDLQEAVQVILEAMKSTKGVLDDPAPDVLVSELAGSSVNLRARWWSKSDRASVVQVSNEVFGRIKRALDEAHIDMPYPTQVVLWHDQTEETDGDRQRQREGWPAGRKPPQSAKLAEAIRNGSGDEANGARG